MQPNNFLNTFAVLAAAITLNACTQQHALRSATDSNSPFYGQQNDPGFHIAHNAGSHKVYASNKNCESFTSPAAAKHFRADHALLPPLTEAYGKPPHSLLNRELPLSPGDMVDVQIENGDGFNGEYVLNPDGSLQLPLLPPIRAAGFTASEISDKIDMALVRAEIFRPSTARSSLRVKHWAAISVTVSGAVFQPGRVTMNQARQEAIIAERLTASGDFSVNRSIVEALRGASGIRPDAKLDQVVLIRAGWQVELDLSGVLSGLPVHDVALIDGDRIVVPTTGCFQSALVTPSQITPKGFRVFMSNLTVPAMDNSGAAVGRYSSNLPYGATLLQAAVSANCVGGTQTTNAPRKVMLASRNPITEQFEVIERSVEALMRYPQREEINPFLMPNDAIACYDSDVTNLRELARSFGEIVAPFKLFF